MSLSILAVACVMLLNVAKPSGTHYFVYWTGDEILPTTKYHNLSLSLFFKWFESSYQIDLIHKSHNVPVLYPTMHNAEQKCAHFYSKWCIVGYEIGALWDLWDCSISLISFIISQLQCELNNASGKKILELSFSCKMASQWFLNFYHRHRISVFPEVMTHKFDIWCVTVTLVHYGHAPNHPQTHWDWFTESNSIFFQTFELLNVSNASSPHICVYVNSRKRLLRCVKKVKGSQIHLYFAMWHNRAHCSQLSIFLFTVIVSQAKVSCHV